jgi:hypothetical protein
MSTTDQTRIRDLYAADRKALAGDHGRAGRT